MRTTTDPKEGFLQARLPADLLAEFKQIIEHDERTASQTLRLLVRDFVEKHHKQAKQHHNKPALKLK